MGIGTRRKADILFHSHQKAANSAPHRAIERPRIEQIEWQIVCLLMTGPKIATILA